MLEDLKRLDKPKYTKTLLETHFERITDKDGKTDEEEISLDNRILMRTIKAESLAARFAKASESQKEEIKSKLKEVLGKLFSLKEAQRLRQFFELDLQLNEMKSSLAKLRHNKEEVIEEKMEEMLSE